MSNKKKLISFSTAVALIVTAFFMPVNVRANNIYQGVDVYEYSNIYNYQILKDSGVSVVIQKATEGLTYNDKLLNYRATMLPKYGFKVGYYHFARHNNPVAEAQHFLSKVKGLHSDTCLWLDIEDEPSWTKSQAVNYANQFINYVHSQGYQIGIYTGLEFYDDYLQGNIPNVPMWLAAYSRRITQFPSVSWQYTGAGSSAGMMGYVDKDYFIDNIFIGSISHPSTSVSALQSQLNSLINARLTVDGVQGPCTAAAVKKFQRIMGLEIDGIAGAHTWAAINQIRSYPVDGVSYHHYEYATRWIQWRVCANINGLYLNNTAYKVKQFQRAHGICADGVVGPITWKMMFR